MILLLNFFNEKRENSTHQSYFFVVTNLQQQQQQQQKCPVRHQSNEIKRMVETMEVLLSIVIRGVFDVEQWFVFELMQDE